MAREETGREECLRACLKKLAQRRDLTAQEAEAAVEEIMSGRATSAQVAAFMTALCVKGETVEEIVGAARAMRARAARFNLPGIRPVDTCGTGGDGKETFNISTAAALVVAAAGVPVAKHGNRAMSSRCGSADVLEALGVCIDLGPDEAAECLKKTGIGFLYAPAFHRAMAHAAAPRREIGIRTIFNILGPLANPAGAEVQLTGVYDEELAQKMARALLVLGVKAAAVVYGAGGADELTLAGPNTLYCVENGEVFRLVVEPEEVGLPRAEVSELAGGDPAENAGIIHRLLEGERGPRRDSVLFNAGVTLALAFGAGCFSHEIQNPSSADGGSMDFKTAFLERVRLGIETAARAIDNGKALEKLLQLVRFTQELSRRSKTKDNLAG